MRFRARIGVTIVVRFGPGDAARCRFAVSPLQEAMNALLVLRDRERHAFYLPWLRTAPQVDLRLLAAAVPVHGTSPDFLWPSPRSPLTTVDEDLARVAATDPEVVRTELARLPSHARTVLGGDPQAVRDALVGQQRLAWEALVAPSWDRIRDLLDADITARARQVADGGLELLFSHLNPRATWRDDALHLAGFADDTIDLQGRGMVLVPTAFGWPALGIGPTRRTEPPALDYPMLGAARLWEPRDHQPALERLLGAARARVLVETVIPSTTTDIARHLGLAPSTVSQHLAALRDAGLVAGLRRGREVRYGRTALGAALAQSR